MRAMVRVYGRGPEVPWTGPQAASGWSGSCRHRPVRWERKPVRANPAASGRWAPIGSMETCPAHCHSGHGPCDDGIGIPGRRRGRRESRIVEHSRQSAWYPTASAIPRLATDRDGPPAHPVFLHYRHRVLPGRTAHRRRRSQRPRAEGQSLRSPDRPVGQAADSAGSTARPGPVRRVLARPDEAGLGRSIPRGRPPRTGRLPLRVARPRPTGTPTTPPGIVPWIF